LGDWQNQQYYPYNTFAFVNTIATNTSLFTPPTPLPVGYEQFYQVDSNPLIGRLTTPSQLGTVATDGKVQRLAIYETEPFDSRLDIYWETTTSGIISELNQQILDGSGAPSDISDWNFALNESFALGSIVANNFYFSDVNGSIIIVPLSDVSLNVLNTLNESRNDWFELEASGFDKFRIKTTDYFYYGYNANILESYTFNFTINTTSPTPITTYITKLGNLSNITPTIIEPLPESTLTVPPGQINIYNFYGINGSNSSGGVDGNDLTWSLIDTSSDFSITPTGLLQQPSGSISSGLYPVTVRLTDAGGLYTDFSFNVSFSDFEGVSFNITSGGPSITQEQALGLWAVEGFINVNSGYTVEIKAGSFPVEALRAVVETDVQITIGSDIYTISKYAYGSEEGGFSDDSITLSEGTFAFTVNCRFDLRGGEGGMYFSIL
jgi:hypothetical protein